MASGRRFGTSGFFCRIALVVAGWVCLPSLGTALDLPSFFSNGMVLQRGTGAPVWGTAEPGSGVVVHFQGNEFPATADAESGRWKVVLDPMELGGPYEMRVSTGYRHITISNILIGEVWLASGQSNMAWPVHRSHHAERETREAGFPRIRVFTVERRYAEEPLDNVKGEWIECSPQTVGDFSAVGYFFARHLHHELEVPVGLIVSAWGGSAAEAWMSREALASNPLFGPILDRLEENRRDYAPAKEKHDLALEKWAQAREEALRSGGSIPNRPPVPRVLQRQKWPLGLHHAMLKPLAPYGLRGVIWYQGEENARRAHQYRALFPALIEDWRNLWENDRWPFYFVQLANFRARRDEPGESDWAELREAQLMALSLPATAMAVAIDIGEADDIHPGNKQEVGHRLALAALAQTYGYSIPFSGPVPGKVSFGSGEVRVRFDHAYGGLKSSGGDLSDFTLAGADRVFHPAEARLAGPREVVLRTAKVPFPVAARYGWADNPGCNLVNSAGLPATPFRTDDWPGLTAGEH